MLSKTNKYELDRLSIGIPYKDKSNVKRYGNGNDLRCAGNVWYIDYPTVNKKEEKPHKDMFPVELPLRCIKLAGKNVNTVLDCFAGSGTTGQACQILNKNFIGIEKDKKYFDIMCQQLNVSNA
jgi:site-specific DNA-methyltransferase (adenine-specific)